MDSTNSSTITSLKTQAKLLRQALADEGIELGHVKCLHAVARSHGYKNWNTARESGHSVPDFQASFVTLDDLEISIKSPSRVERKVEWVPLYQDEWYTDEEHRPQSERERHARHLQVEITEMTRTDGITMKSAVGHAAEILGYDWDGMWIPNKLVSPAWVKQVLEDMVATGYMTHQADRYVPVEFEGYNAWFPHEHDQIGGLAEMLKAGVSLGDAFRRFAGCYVATARRYFRLAQVADSDPRVYVYDPSNDPPETDLHEVMGPKEVLDPLVEEHVLDRERDGAIRVPADGS